MESSHNRCNDFPCYRILSITNLRVGVADNGQVSCRCIGVCLQLGRMDEQRMHDTGCQNCRRGPGI